MEEETSKGGRMLQKGSIVKEKVMETRGRRLESDDSAGCR